MEQLKRRIKENDFTKLTLFYGEEIFMLDFYLKKVVKQIISDGDLTMNYDEFSDSKATLETLVEGLETLPFFSDRRVIVMKNLGLFEKKKADFAKKLAEKLENIPETTYVIIVENAPDKRVKLFKTIKKQGSICEFSKLNEGELVNYIGKMLNKYSKKIDKRDARYLIGYVGDGLTVLHNELEKLVNYTGEETIVTKEHMEAICQKSIESKIFELVDCMGTKRRGRALKLYNDLLASREPANRVLFMLMRQFRLSYKSKLFVGEGFNANDIAVKLKVQSFVARKCIEQGRGFTIDSLEEALKDCLQTEIDIRTGIFKPDMAVEQLIIKYSGI